MSINSQCSDYEGDTLEVSILEDRYESKTAINSGWWHI